MEKCAPTSIVIVFLHKFPLEFLSPITPHHLVFTGFFSFDSNHSLSLFLSPIPVVLCAFSFQFSKRYDFFVYHIPNLNNNNCDFNNNNKKQGQQDNNKNKLGEERLEQLIAALMTPRGNRRFRWIEIDEFRDWLILQSSIL